MNKKVIFLSLFLSTVSVAAPKWKKVISSSGASSLNGGYQEFNQDGTFTVPAGVTKIFYTIVGAGGGGGGSGAGGGGGGGSCLKDGATTVASANGGTGGASGLNGTNGTSVVGTYAVTPGATLNIYVGGGGGGGYLINSNGYYFGGSGGYGPCGNGGAGGAYNAATGGAGGANKGGGGGAANTAAGIAATSTTGGAGAYHASGSGGACTAGSAGSASGPGPGIPNSVCATGGGSGGLGGCHFGAASLAMNSGYCGAGTFVKKEPGEGGTYVYIINGSNVFNLGTGGGGGAVYIWW